MPAPALPSAWPAQPDPKTLMCVRVPCKVAELFRILFGSSELQDLLHKQRNDTDLAETPWLARKEDVPAVQYTWDVPEPTGQGPSETLRHRKTRFKSPPAAMAPTPFSNEEVQSVLEFLPDKRYVVEAASTTSAPYGDKFTVYFKYDIRADGPSASTMLLIFHVEFLPSMNRMMKPMVGKAVEAGVRGTFKVFRSCLGVLQPGTQDIKEAQIGPTGETAAELAAADVPPNEDKAAGAAAAQAHPAAHHGHDLHVMPPPTGPPWLNAMTQTLVYRDQVNLLADLVGVGMRSVSHNAPAAQILAVLLTLWLISVAVSAIRAYHALCAGRSSLLLALCWPLHFVDLPDSTGEVLSALALVAAINWGVIAASQAGTRYLQQQQGLTQAEAAGQGGHPLGSNGPGSGGSFRGRRSSGGGGAAGEPMLKQAPGSAPSAASGKAMQRLSSSAAPTTEAAAAAKDGAASSKSATRSGGAAGSSSDAPAAAAPATAAPAAPLTKASSKASKAVRAAPPPKPFPAMQLAQLEMQQHSQKEQNPSRVAAAGGGPSATAAKPTPEAGKARVSGSGASAVAAAASGVAAPAVTAGVTAGVQPAASARHPSPAKPTPASAAGMADAWAADFPGLVPDMPEPLLSPTSLASADGVHPAGPSASMVSAAGRAFSPERGGGQAADDALQHQGGSKVSTGGFAQIFSKEGLDSMADSFKAAFTWDARPELGRPGGGSTVISPTAMSTTAARGGGSSRAFARASADGMQTFFVGESASGADAPSVSYSATEPTIVVEEVYENERFQPFRGWGHQWPGHFLPSDRVGHWSDRQGKPGGTASMEFRMVEPRLPRGWKWLEEGWEIDLEGYDQEAVDAEGWTYALDFYLLKYPPNQGNGKCSIKHFVRRRRYTRTRVCIDPGTCSETAAPAGATSGGSSLDGSLGHELLQQLSGADQLRAVAGQTGSSSQPPTPTVTGASANAEAAATGAAGSPRPSPAAAPAAPASPSAMPAAAEGAASAGTLASGSATTMESFSDLAGRKERHAAGQDTAAAAAQAAAAPLQQRASIGTTSWGPFEAAAAGADGFSSSAAAAAAGGSGGPSLPFLSVAAPQSGADPPAAVAGVAAGYVLSPTTQMQYDDPLGALGEAAAGTADRSRSTSFKDMGEPSALKPPARPTSAADAASDSGSDSGGERAPLASAVPITVVAAAGAVSNQQQQEDWPQRDALLHVSQAVRPLSGAQSEEDVDGAPVAQSMPGAAAWGAADPVGTSAAGSGALLAGSAGALTPQAAPASAAIAPAASVPSAARSVVMAPDQQDFDDVAML